MRSSFVNFPSKHEVAYWVFYSSCWEELKHAMSKARLWSNCLFSTTLFVFCFVVVCLPSNNKPFIVEDVDAGVPKQQQ